MPRTVAIGSPTMIALALVLVASSAPKQDETSARQAEVTIRGNVLCSRAMEARPWFWDLSDGNHTPIIFALEGTPAIARQLETIMEGYPDGGLLRGRGFSEQASGVDQGMS